MRKAILIPFILILSILAGCEDLPDLSLDKDSVSFGPEGGNETVTVTANFPWEASASHAWISIQYHEGGNTLRISALRNQESDRRGSVTVTSMGLSKTISVSQETTPLQVLRFTVGGVSSFRGPAFRVPAGVSFQGVVYWTSGAAAQEYRNNLTRDLDPGQEHNVRIEARNIEAVTFDDVAGLLHIDFTEL